MRVLFTSISIFLLQLAPVRTQIVEDVLDLIPGKGSANLANSEITGFIDYQYSGEISKLQGEANHFSAVFIDSSGHVTRSVEFNRFKEPENYFCNVFNESGRLIQRIHCEAGGRVLWKEGFFYDVSGKLVEQVEYAENGSIDGKTLFFYNADEHLYKTRELNHAGELSFWRIIYYSATELPERITLRQARGFTMSNALIRYNDHSLPVERKVSAGLKSSISRQEYFYDSNDLLVERRSYNDGDLISIDIRNYCRQNFDRMLMENKLFMDDVICPGKNSDHVVSGFVSDASFPGGTAALEAYLISAVKMAEPASQQGVVIVEFEVRPNGKIRKEKVQKGLSPLLDETAVDIVRDMPKWVPAKSPDGEFLKSTVYLPVVFCR